ncbi:hypothetical protein SNEBB_010606 [Seison nebaliae]|nr:hypothetical protein SNEBB_010606 [Seison nebaliae]
MSYLDTLTIQGVRSYGVNEEDRQEIQFLRPLTIIVGMNGSGKTTIIESLKFSCTGEMPPGSSDAMFVHDPKLANKNPVYAQVRLMLRDKDGVFTRITRTMKVVLGKNKKIKFSSMDGLIGREDVNKENNIIEVTSRCVDMNKEIPLSLGVSKALLKYVIFCHQEDSNWPLSEGKLLKTRLDEIFDSKGYMDALDELRKQKKKYKEEMTVKKIELNSIEQNCVKAKNLHETILSKKKIITEKKEERKIQKDRLETTENMLMAIMKQTKDVRNAKTNYDILNSKLGLIRKQRDDLYENMTDILDDEREILEKKLKEIETDNKMKVEKLKNLENNKKETENIISEYNRTNCQLQIERNQLIELKKNCLYGMKQMIEQYDKLSKWESSVRYIVERDLLQSGTIRNGIEEKLASLEKENVGNPVTFSDVVDLFKELIKNWKIRCRLIEEDLKKEFNEKLGEKKLTESNFREKLDKENKKVIETKFNVNGKKMELNKIKNQLKEMENIMQTTNERNKEIIELTSQIEELELDYEKKKFNYESNEYEKKIIECDSDIEERDKLTDMIRKDLNNFQLKLHNEEKLKVFTDQYEKELRKIDLLKENFGIKKLFDELPKDLELDYKKWNNFNLKYQVNIKELEKFVKELQGKWSDVKGEITSITHKTKEYKKLLLENELETNKISKSIDIYFERMKKRIETLPELSQQIYSISELLKNNNSEKLLGKWKSISEEIHRNHKNVERRLHLQSHLHDARSSFLKDLNETEKREEVDCSLCHRKFKNEKEIIYSIKKIEVEIESIPKKLDELKKKENSLKEILTFDKEITSMLSRSVQLMKDKESYELKNQDNVIQMDCVTENLKKMEEEMELNNKRLDERKSTYEKMKNLLPILIELKETQGKMEGIKIKEFVVECSIGGARKCSKEMINELKLKENENGKLLMRKRGELKRLKDENNSSKSSLTYVKTTIQNKKDRLLSLKETSLKSCEMVEKKMKKESERSLIVTEIEKEEEILPKLLEEVKKIRQEEKLITEQEEEGMDQIKKNMDKFRHILQIITLKKKELNDQTKDVNLDEKTKELYGRMEKNCELKKTSIVTLGKVNEDLQNRRRIIDNKSSMVRMLKDNILLNQLKKEESEVDKQFKELKRITTNSDIEELLEKEKILQNDREDIQQRISTLNGSLEALISDYSRLEREMKNYGYDTIHGKYQTQMIQIISREKLVEDMDKIYIALDKSVTSYHNHQMKTINDTLRELWNKTYRGNDIERIEIRFDDDNIDISKLDAEDQLLMSGASKAKRNYSYRVVMVSSKGIEVDMRGRCSAGQRVLACILIRLSIVQAFCSNCFIMTLDEPTTNLDTENIAGLAESLRELIDWRRKISNFQMIIITHDEDFLDIFCQKGIINGYYRISKTMEGASQISRKIVSNI